MPRLAAIDIGSQTIRLLVADSFSETGLTPVYKDRAIIRLGEGVAESGLLAPDAMKRAVVCVADFIALARQMNAESIYATATACVRFASNRNVFLREVYHAAGILPRVLSGQEEAHISQAGVTLALPALPPSMVVLDIGGGSTELIAMDGNTITKTVSIPLGVIGLRERFCRHDPPLDSELAAMASNICALLQEYGVYEAAFTQPEAIIGGAGTVTTLAAMDMSMTEYDSQRINGYCLTKNSIQKLFRLMIPLTVDARSRLPGLEPGRAAVLPAGSAILLEVLNLLGKDMVVVSDGGLLEGILLQHL